VVDTLYRWSSYRFYAYGEPNELVDRDPLYETLGQNVTEQERRYREFIQDGIPEEILKQIRHSIKDNHILGQDTFVEGIENKFYLKRRNRRRERPRKISL
jgi:hypothetical protein